MRKATRTQWIKFSIVTLLYLAFLVWVKSWLGLIVLPFIFDIYISKKIPWGFWKKSENPAVRSIMSWVDAIVFALVDVYFVNIYVFQNYQIPSSSLEKSLLVGDFLYVSKMSYGPRVPNTPLSMPLAQHTLPVFNTKSYIEWPQWEYKRVPGFGKVKLNDIVVFNFPAGDTVATNFQQTGRELMTIDEVRKLDTKEAILFIRGENPVLDQKYDLKRHPNIGRTADGKATPYVHKPQDAPDYALPDLPYTFQTLDDYEFIDTEETEHDLENEESFGAAEAE